MCTYDMSENAVTTNAVDYELKHGEWISCTYEYIDVADDRLWRGSPKQCVYFREFVHVCVCERLFWLLEASYVP